MNPARRSRFAAPIRERCGLTIIELLISTTISLAVMAATVALFGVVADKINNGRALLETNDRMRSVTTRLSADLDGVTVDALPWGRPESASGYLELIKGVARDYFPNNGIPTYSNPGYAGNYGPEGPLPQQPNPNEEWDANYLLGYTMDVLFLTTRSKDLPFVGRYLDPVSGQAKQIESQVAEVVWFMYPTTNGSGNVTSPPTYTLYRRQLLVRPDLPAITPPAVSSQQPLNHFAYFCENYDISAHLAQNPNDPDNPIYVPNNLADLAYRENRFAHGSPNNPVNAIGRSYPNYPYLVQAPGPIPNFSEWVNSQLVNFPVTNPTIPSLQPFWPPPPSPASPAGSPPGDPRYGDDVMLTNVLSFDIKVWDPLAEVRVNNNTPQPTPLVPSDPGWAGGQSSVPPLLGCYVDLNYAGTANIPYPSYFCGPYYGAGLKSGLAPTANSPVYAGMLAQNRGVPDYATYDTWSAGYKLGFTGGSMASVPAGINGFDNDGANGVDDPNELQTSPPYPVPLRGMQIHIRVYEPSSRQVREVTVAESFLPD